jgi:hypothetical protein
MYEKYLMGKNYFRQALPNIDAFAGAKEYIQNRSFGNQIQTVELYTGTGLSVCVHPDRGMDIGAVHYCGIPISFVQKSGVKSPKIIDERDFTRNFFAGLLTTCGLDNVGGDCIIDGKYFPTHGRLNLTPAESWHIEKHWSEDEYFVEVIGDVRLASLFGENLVLRRTIKVKAGESRIFLKDQIINEGYEKQAYMLLYHCNFGFPIVSEDSYVLTNHNRVEYLDEQSKVFGRNNYDLSPPQPGFKQSAFLMFEPKEERVRSAIINPKLRLGVYVECNQSELPQFCEWMNLGALDYTIGLEPAKTAPVGRTQSLADRTIIWLDPLEMHQTELEIGVLIDEEMDHYSRLIRK